MFQVLITTRFATSVGAAVNSVVVGFETELAAELAINRIERDEEARKNVYAPSHSAIALY